MQSFVQNVEITVKQSIPDGSSGGGQGGSISMRCKRRQALSYLQADVSLVLHDLHSQSGLGSHSAYPLATEAAIRSSPPEVFLKKVFRKYAANLQENTHAEVWFLSYSRFLFTIQLFTKTLTITTCRNLHLVKVQPWTCSFTQKVFFHGYNIAFSQSTFELPVNM